MISSLIGFLTSPLGIALLIGAFSGGARLWAKMQEQRAKQAQIQARRQMERDALRTGGRALETQPQPTPRGAWDQDQQSKRDRIEELRRRRIEQLQKLREQRSGASSAQSSVMTPAPVQTPQRAPSQAQPSQRGPQRAAPPPRTPQRRAQPSPAQRQAQQVRRTPQRPQSPRPPQPAARRDPRPPQQRQPEPTAAPVQTSIGEIQDPAPAPVAVRAPTQSGSRRFASRQALRDAIIAKEVLGPPVALREEHAADPFVL
jgi:hypothetical protein